MSDVLPLLLLPAVVGWWISEWKQRTARPALRRAVVCARPQVLLDAGQASVILVARSLHVRDEVDERPCPWWVVGRRRRTWDVRELVAPLDLELTEVIGVRRDRLGRVIGFHGASRFSGTRQGRRVNVELGASSTTIAIDTVGSMSDFTVSGDRHTGQLVARGAVPATLDAALETLAASRHWRGVRVDGVGSGIVLRREHAIGSSWLHDLWLVEFVADLAAPAGLQEGAAAPSAPVRSTNTVTPVAIGV